jgi:membrane protease YdiL (CAAX protease family)
MTVSRASPSFWARLGSLAFVITLQVASWHFTFPYVWQWLTTWLGVDANLLARQPWIRDVGVHTWAAALALIAIRFVGGKAWRDWGGLNLKNYRVSLHMLKEFVLIYGGATVVMQTYSWLTQPQICNYGLALTPQTHAGYLAFDWLWVGVTEEIIFQGLGHSFLRRWWPEVFHWRRIHLPVAGVLAAILFSVAHVGLSFAPLCVTWFSSAQLLTTFVLGLHFSAMYYKTGSLLHPILAHNIGDGLVVTYMYALMWFTNFRTG